MTPKQTALKIRIPAFGLFFFAITCSMMLAAVDAPAELVDRVVAIVNEDIILQSDLDQIMSPLRQKLQSEGYSEAQQRMLLADQQPKILEQLITDKLTDQRVREYQLKVGDAEIDATLARIKAANRFSDERLLQVLEMEGVTLESYRESIREQLLRQKLLNREIKSKIVITDQDIRAYYDKHADSYAGKTKYHLRQILLRVSDEASESERKRIYSLMETVYNRLQAGEPFSNLAEVYSEAPSAAKGGDLGIFELRLLAPEIKSALKGMSKGQYTPILDTDHGYQIFFLEDILHTDGKSFEEAKPEIEEKLYAETMDQKFQSWLKDLRRQSHVETLE